MMYCGGYFSKASMIYCGGLTYSDGDGFYGWDFPWLFYCNNSFNLLLLSCFCLVKVYFESEVVEGEIIIYDLPTLIKCIFKL